MGGAEGRGTKWEVGVKRGGGGRVGVQNGKWVQKGGR